ncbi:MAG: hypothetical protein RRZ93_05770 [Ruthenibacterium sp.]
MLKKKKITRILISFLIPLLLAVFLLAQNALRRSTHIVLPTLPQTPTVVAPGEDSGSLLRVEVTPESVQDVIATLQRPSNYRRSITTQTIWSGGSGITQTVVAVLDRYTRTDTTTAGGQLRHCITDGETSYIWYGASKNYYTGAAGDITADDEQHIPSYEDILQLPREGIQTADYRALSDTACIYVETTADEGGYVDRYWVSVDSGLLLEAESLQQGEAVYRMTALPIEAELPISSDFLLPDGTQLLS